MSNNSCVLVTLRYLLNPSRCADTLKDLTRFWLATKVPEGKDRTNVVYHMAETSVAKCHHPLQWLLYVSEGHCTGHVFLIITL